MRAFILAAGIALLSACGEKEPDIACCAIEPKAKCESALAGLGVSREQLAILMTSEKVCPSVEFTAERLRELDAQWPIDCREAGGIVWLAGGEVCCAELRGGIDLALDIREVGSFDLGFAAGFLRERGEVFENGCRRAVAFE